MNQKTGLLLLFMTIAQLAIGQNERVNLPEDFPKPPHTKERLFYLQRNLNENTVVYDVNLQANGEIDSDKPVSVYWRRYAGNGEKLHLKWIEKKFAYGYNSKKRKDGDGYTVKLVAYDDRYIHVKKDGDGYIALLKINGKIAQLTNLYVYAVESTLWPDVKHIDIFGKDLNTGEVVYERFFN